MNLFLKLNMYRLSRVFRKNARLISTIPDSVNNIRPDINKNTNKVNEYCSQIASQIKIIKECNMGRITYGSGIYSDIIRRKKKNANIVAACVKIDKLISEINNIKTDEIALLTPLIDKIMNSDYE